jgi:hypothetical protein
VDLVGADDTHPVDALSGIAFLLMMVPAISAALLRAVNNSTVRVEASHVARMESLVRDPQLRDCCWINRRNALISQPAFTFTITATGERLERDELEAWVKGQPSPLAKVPIRGLLAGLQRAKGLLVAPVQPAMGPFRLVIALPKAHDPDRFRRLPRAQCADRALREPWLDLRRRRRHARGALGLAAHPTGSGGGAARTA